MATVTKGKTFISGETVEPADMHQLVDSATVTNIVDADISASAAIAGSKLADGAVTNAKVDASAAIAYSKLALTNSIVAGDLTSASVTAAKLDGAQTGSAPIYGCRAWVSFVGTTGSTVDGEFRCTINGSGNVTKVVRNSIGSFTVHLTTAMPSASYAVTMSYQIASATNTGRAVATTTSTIDLAFSDTGGGENPLLCGIAVFG